jgi:small subunit ribosomal protein S2
MKQLLESGVHFGHQSRLWNPKMKQYIYTERNGIYIIDLKKTLKMLREACQFVRDSVAEGKTILFVGTKKQAKDSIRDAANECGMYYVNNRWLGGMLTNFSTIKKSLVRLKKIEKMEIDGTFEQLTKKEVARLLKEKGRLEKNLGGIKNMNDLPGVMFVIDTKKEAIAVAEARRMGIPIIAVVDTNCNPDGIDYPIPGNDDAIRAINLFTNVIANAVVEADNEQGLKVIDTLQDDDEEGIISDSFVDVIDKDSLVDPADMLDESAAAALKSVDNVEESDKEPSDEKPAAAEPAATEPAAEKPVRKPGPKKKAAKIDEEEEN